ncbi:MAG: HYR domain-containing protein, partial [Phycisphaerae bacterium]|nr:HYR domain-containing protein [Saprospiraceae bacterium]
TLEYRPQPTRTETLGFCPGESVMIAGQIYNQPGTVQTIVASTNGGCDTIVTYNLQLRPQPILTATRSFCPGESVTIAGQTYNEPGTVIANLASTTGGCDTIATFTLELHPQHIFAATRSFCPGESVTIAGQTYNQPGTVVVNLASTTGGCDTVATYTLQLGSQPTLAETRGFCPGESVTIAGQTYNQPGTITVNLSSATGGCDTIATYTLEIHSQHALSATRSFCPGESVTIAGQTYNQPGTVIATLASTTGGCDTIATYTLELRPQPTRAETRGFCPGESVIIAGQTYTQPGTVIANLASTTGGCDTVVTYTLQNLTPAPSNIAMQCPSDVTVVAASGTGTMTAIYPEPLAASDCICPGLQLIRIYGPASGSQFTIGTTQISYKATDNCGQEKTCNFAVKVQEESACDVKVNGCMKYELLSITSDPGNNRTYRIRVTNSCSDKLIYTAIEIPYGLTTLKPANNAFYTSNSGRTYAVRTPNYTPMYSIRFKSMADSIANGQSDIFEYTLPAQSDVTYVNLTSRLSTQVQYEAHLNTFKCPVGGTPNNDHNSLKDRGAETLENQNSLLLFPNPTTGVLYADLSDWQGQKLQVQVTNAQGQLVHTLNFTADEDLLRVEMPRGLTAGVYFFELKNEKGEKEVLRFVLQR